MRNDRTAYSSRRVRVTPSACVLVVFQVAGCDGETSLTSLVPVSSLCAQGRVCGAWCPHIFGRVRTHSEPSGLLSIWFGHQGQTCYLCAESDAACQFSAERRPLPLLLVELLSSALSHKRIRVLACSFSCRGPHWHLPLLLRIMSVDKGFPSHDMLVRICATEFRLSLI